MNGYITKNGKLNKNLLKKDFSLLDLVIKEHTNDEEFIPFAYKLETNLPVIYIDVSQ